MNRRDSVHALVAWFNCDFSNFKNSFNLDTSPYSKYTHWKHTIFYLDKVLDVQKGDVLKGNIAVRKSIVNFRELDVKISYHMNTEQTIRNYV